MRYAHSLICGIFGRTDLHTAFLGAGDAFDGLVALSRDLGLNDIVEFTGSVPDKVVQSYLSTADVCLHQTLRIRSMMSQR